MQKKAVFLDRDGVINEEKGYITSINGLSIFSFALNAIKRIKQAGFLTIVVTNQSAIARGMLTEETLMEINTYLKDRTGMDAVYYCPHHIDGIIDEYTKTCHCRKPDTGMIERACKDYNINLSDSWMIGDRISDIRTGKKAGLKTVLVKSGYDLTSQEIAMAGADFLCDDLEDWVDNVLVVSSSLC